MTIHSESHDLKEARRILDFFERNPTKPEGIAKLAEALSALSDIRETAIEEHERKVATNLFAAYARIAEEHADRFLLDFDSIPDDDIEQWHTVMQEFEQLTIPLPESFSAKRTKLISLLIKRLFLQLTPYEKRKLLGNDDSNGKD